VNKAFVLGAGLGQRLRPLTERLPKPLIPHFHRPLICRAFDHVIAAGVTGIVVNTHHMAGRYAEAFPSGLHGGVPVAFIHESPDRLETAGGIANARPLLDDGAPFLVYNGDILTDLPLAPLLEAHARGRHLVTLALRTLGPAPHISLDAASGDVLDIRYMLGTGHQGGLLFTGIYVVSPGFFEWLSPGKKESVIPVFLRLIQEGRLLGGVVIDEGQWRDLGDRDSYLEAHLAETDPALVGTAIHPLATVHPDARLEGRNVVGPGAVVEEGARLRDCVLWAGAVAARGCDLERCIVREDTRAEGTRRGEDL
jgi:mannose-1-phosphate guanylyltransferase